MLSSSVAIDVLSTPVVAIPLLLILGVLFFLRPRFAKNSDAPPMVLSSPVVKIPLIGQVLEFGLSPVKMTKRCYEQYGPVFTVPVSLLNLFNLLLVHCTFFIVLD